MLTSPSDHAVATDVATRAGELLLKLRADVGATAHDWWSLRDEGDWSAHQFIVEALHELRPDDKVLSEEGMEDRTRLGAERVWIVDPLDGTREFGEAGRSDWAVHVALVDGKGQPLAGAVALPALGVTLSTDPAPPPPPAYEGPPRIIVSRTRPPAVAIRVAEALGGELVAMGSAGAKAMAVVLGEADVYAHAGGQYEWDNCAPAAVAAAAGLHASRINGRPLVYNQPDPWLPDLLICRPELADAALNADRELVDLKVVRYEVDGGVAVVTLHRPDRLNAWTGRMHTEYRWVLAEAERDDRVRVIVVTGAGRAFCAGADTTALDGHAERGAYDAGVDAATLATPGYGVRAEFDHAFAFHYGIPKPVIAAINGPAAGVGLVLACYCDVRYAAAGAKLTTSNGRLGLPAEYGLSWVLPRLVGIGHAADLLFSSRVPLAEEAERIGLVNRTFPADELLPATLEYARTIAAEISPSSLRESKRQLYADLHGDVGTAVAESERLLERMATEPDFREGVAAWREKRPPRF